MATTLILDGKSHAIEVLRWRPHLVVMIDGRRHEVSAFGDGRDGDTSVDIGGAQLRFVRATDYDVCHLRIDGRTLAVRREDPFAGAGTDDHAHDMIKAPMPGVVVELFRATGDKVVRGDKVATIESMKLQTVLIAPRDGILSRINRAAGETFEKDAVIAELEPLADEA